LKKEAVIVFQLLFVVLVLAVMYVVSGISPGELKELLVSRFFLAFIVVMLLVEILRGLRLKIVTEYLLKDNKLSVSSFVLSRLVGNLAGLFTPSSFGTVPAQAVALSSRHPYPIEKFIGSGLITSMVDALVAAAVNIALFFIAEKASVLALASSIVIALLWVSGIYLVFFRNSVINRIMNGVYKRFRAMASRSAMIDRRVRDFQEGVRLTITNPVIFVVSFVLGLLSFILVGLSALLVSGVSEDIGLFEVLLVGSSLYVLSSFPTPGGSGFYELGLVEVLGILGALRARLSFVLFYVATGLVSLFLLTRDVKKFKESLRKSIVID